VLDRAPPGLMELGREVDELLAAWQDDFKHPSIAHRASRRMREVAALYAFADRLVHADSLAEVYEAALDAIIAGLECDRASVLVFDEYGAMRFVAWRELSAEYRQAVDGHSPWQINPSGPEPITVKDILTSDVADELKVAVVEEGIRGLAFIPLIADGRLIGKFMTYYNTPHEFENDEINLATTIASQVAFGIERKRAQGVEKTLMNELQHRTNNLLTVVQAVAHQSLRERASLEEGRSIFENRLQALAKANRQLANANWSGLKLADLIRQELEPFATRVHLQGPQLILGPQQAQNFSLAIHELATNAVKYGALSNPNGSVQLSWEVDGANNELKFRWEEIGGPAVVTPQKQGFGTSLIKSMFSQLDIAYPPTGFRCEVTAPLTRGSG
jgi:two-component sensor histidine kinase